MLRRLTFICIFALLGASVGAAQAAPVSKPATQPASPDVYLLPFTALGIDNTLDWAGRAVQQNLLTDLTRSKMHAVAADKAISTTADAQAAAKEVGAKYLIAGSYQMAEQLVRFNGQLISTNTGTVLGGISATGALRDLFNLEDSLSAQTIQLLTQLPGPATRRPLPVALQPPAIRQMMQPPSVAPPGTASGYQGSALQQYVNADRSPSTDYAQQVQDAQYRSTFGSSNNFGYGYGYGGLYSPFYFGGGYSFGLYSRRYGGLGGYRGAYYGGYRQHIVNADR